MGNFAVANVEQLEAGRLFVANVYDDNTGQLINQLIVEFEDYPTAVALLIEAEVSHVWTSSRELYGELLQLPNIGAELKHASQTAETGGAVARQAELLTDLFSIEPAVKPAPVAAWRRWVAEKLTKLAHKIGGI